MYICRYSHGVRANLQKKIVGGEELEYISDLLTGALLAPIIDRQYGSFLQDLEDLVSKEGTVINFAKMANRCLTTLGITLNYFAQPHVDLEDEGFAFLTWFTKGKLKKIHYF